VLACATLWFALGASAALHHVSPFGFPLGVRLDPAVIAASGCQRHGEARTCRTAPKPVADVKSYFVLLTEGRLGKVGALWAFGEDRDGAKVRRRFEELKTSLESKYGRPRRTRDSLSRESLWKRPGDFAMALQDGDRELSATWKVEGTTIVMKAFGQDMTDTGLLVSYEHDRLMALRETRKSDAEEDAL